MAGLTGPLASLSLLFGSSILTGVALDVSWMTGIPMLLILCGAAATAATCIEKSNVIPLYPQTVSVVTAPLSLAGIASSILTIYYGLEWAFIVPSIVTVLWSTIMFVHGFLHVKAKFQTTSRKIGKTGPVVSLSTLIGWSILSGVAMEFSWIAGGLMLICMCGVAFWTCYSVHKWHDKPQSINALITLTIINAIVGVASVLCTVYFPLPVTSLNLVLLAFCPVLCTLFAHQWLKVYDHLRTVVAVTAPLSLLAVVSTGLCFHSGWPTLIPNCLFLFYSLSLLIVGLMLTQMNKHSLALRIASLMMLPACGAASFLTFFFYPLLFPVAITTTAASAAFVLLIDYPEALIALTISMGVYGLACVFCSIYFSPPIIALNIILVAATPVHIFLFVQEWPKISKYPRTIVAISALLTLVGVLSTGIFIRIAGGAVAPCSILLIYSMVLLWIGLYQSKIIESHVTAIMCMIVALGGLFSSFLAYFLAPFYWPLALITTFVAAPLLVFADAFASGPCWGFFGYTGVLKLAFTAAYGVVIVTDMSTGWMWLILMALMFISMIMGVLWCMQQCEDYKSAPAARHSILLLGSLFITVLLLVASIIAFHFVYKSFPVLIPFNLVGAFGLSMLAISIISRFRTHTKSIGATAVLLFILFFYCFMVSALLKGVPGVYREPGFEAHSLAALITLYLSFHCLLICVVGSHISEEQQNAATAAPNPAAGVVAAAVPAPAAAAPIVIERDVDSDYESVAGEDN